MRNTICTLFAIPAALLALSASADVSKVDQSDLLKALGKPVEKKTEKVDGCNLTRYKFLNKVVGVSIEFRCDRLNLSWFNGDDPEVVEQVKANRELAGKAMAALSGGDGHEVAQAVGGEVFRGKSLLSDLELRGSCQGDICLLTFR